MVASDGQLESTPATIEFQVISKEHSPVAHGLSLSLLEDDDSGPFTLNGADPNGDPLSFHITQAPSFGTLSGQPPNLRYRPNPDFYGLDSFRFRVHDGVLVSADATVLLNVVGVNDPPLLAPRQFTLDEDADISVILSALDIDGDPLTYHIESQPLHGTLTGTSPLLRYRPDPNFNGQDSFRMKVEDTSGAFSEVAIISLTVRAINDLPVASDQQLTTPEDTSLDLRLEGRDPDGGPVNFNVLQFPQLGSLSGNAPALRYTPHSDLHGSDSFTFSVTDSEGVSAQGTVRIEVTSVNDPPVAADHRLSMVGFDKIELPQLGSDPDGDTLNVEIITPPGHGQLSFAGGVYFYDHSGDDSIEDAFIYRVEMVRPFHEMPRSVSTSDQRPSRFFRPRKSSANWKGPRSWSSHATPI